MTALTDVMSLPSPFAPVITLLMTMNAKCTSLLAVKEPSSGFCLRDPASKVDSFALNVQVNTLVLMAF